MLSFLVFNLKHIPATPFSEGIPAPESGLVWPSTVISHSRPSLNHVPCKSGCHFNSKNKTIF
jgi:hypothetical protein